MKRNILIGLAIGSIASVASAGVGGPTIYAINNLGDGGITDNTLVMFDATNPAGYTTIGGTGVSGAGFTGLDFNGVGGDLFAYAGYGTGITPGLYQIDLTTGAASIVGSLSGQALQDLAYNPVDGMMYGIEGTSLYTVNTTTGAVTLSSTFSGLPSNALPVGLAIDSNGTFFVHDLASDAIYSGDGTNMTSMYSLPVDTNFSQGMTIDWSRDDQGYHSAIGQLPAFYSHLYTFGADGSGYDFVGNFGTGDGVFPTFEGGDLAIMAVPAPGALALLGLAGLASGRRRRH